MDPDSPYQGTMRASQNMTEEAEQIASGLALRSFTGPQEALERLRCDFFNLPDAQLLDLQKNLEVATSRRGLANPLSRIPETKQTGFNTLTGEEIVVLTNPFDDRIEASRLSHEQSFAKNKDQMWVFETRFNSMVDHRANIAAFHKEEMLRSPRYDE